MTQKPDVVDKDSDEYARHVTFLPQGATAAGGDERRALQTIDPAGFFIRHPPKPHELDTELTGDAQLFQTIHMGAAVVDRDRWTLLVDGRVGRRLTVDFGQLRAMPATTVTSFHECYGSPVAAPVHALWRIGNVEWTGVKLAEILKLARPLPGVTHVWSRGLEGGSFAGVDADHYEKDLTIEKASQPEVLLAYKMNGSPLTKERGGPVRLVVPGWFGTNSTKWLCRISLQSGRATGPFTTRFYNEVDPTDPLSERPVWMVEPNSMIVRPIPGDRLPKSDIEVWGRAWGCEEIRQVLLSIDGGSTWLPPSVVSLRRRKQFEWQLFSALVRVDSPGKYTLVARATDHAGVSQPLTGRRNHVHAVEIEVVEPG